MNLRRFHAGRYALHNLRLVVNHRVVRLGRGNAPASHRYPTDGENEVLLRIKAGSFDVHGQQRGLSNGLVLLGAGNVVVLRQGTRRLAGTPGSPQPGGLPPDRKSTRLNSSHVSTSYAVFCLKYKTKKIQ